MFSKSTECQDNQGFQLILNRLEAWNINNFAEEAQAVKHVPIKMSDVEIKKSPKFNKQFCLRVTN